MFLRGSSWFGFCGSRTESPLPVTVSRSLTPRLVFAPTGPNSYGRDLDSQMLALVASILYSCIGLISPRLHRFGFSCW